MNEKPPMLGVAVIVAASSFVWLIVGFILGRVT
jgi:hypothetical protein